MHHEITKQMLDAIASYTGPVTLYPPGKPRAPGPSPAASQSVAWLQRQPGGGWPKETLAVKRQRLQAHAERIAEHNKAVRKARGLRKSDGR